LRFAFIALMKTCQSAIRIDERVARVNPDALVKVRDGSDERAVNEQRAATFEVSVRVYGVEFDGVVEVVDGAIKVELV
jgi:hypothetical protein